MNIKRQIADACEELLQKKDLDKITVTEVVNLCGISRQTFYYHFQDLMAVGEWIVNVRIKQAYNQCLKKETLWEAIKIILDEIYNDRNMIKRLKYSKNLNNIQNLLIETLQQLIKQLLEIKIDYVNGNISEFNLIIDFYSCGIMTSMHRYCDKENFDTEKYSKTIEKIIMSNISSILSVE